MEARRTLGKVLEDIDRRILQYFAVIIEDIVVATDTLLGTDEREAAMLVREREKMIENAWRELEHDIELAFAREAPVASDLRFLLSAVRLIPELERTHDLVEHIWKRGRTGLGRELPPVCRGIVAELGRVVREMWAELAEAYIHRDAGVEESLQEKDDDVDELRTQLVAGIIDGNLPTSVVTEMVLIARFYERIGDHAVNISRRVVYLARGHTAAAD